jgi:hypothetical protein
MVLVLAGCVPSLTGFISSVEGFLSVEEMEKEGRRVLGACSWSLRTSQGRNARQRGRFDVACEISGERDNNLERIESLRELLLGEGFI